jgi:4-hydroxy-2-oxoheptanedioate aldolase
VATSPPGRLNKVIGLLEQGKVAFGTFLPPGSIPDAMWASTTPYDFVSFEMEHSAFNLTDLRISLQFLLDRRQLVTGGTLAPSPVPMVRLPLNGREQGEWMIKQVLDIGVYWIIFHMINTAADAIHALRAARYTQLREAADAEPVGRRGHAPDNAMRYWGLSQPEYFARADVWPLDPLGEILPILQCETIEAVEQLPELLRQVPKPGVILISESDLSVSMGLGGAVTDEVQAAVQRALSICKAHGVPTGNPNNRPHNIAQRIADGFQLLALPAARDLSLLDQGLAAASRSSAVNRP